MIGNPFNMVTLGEKLEIDAAAFVIQAAKFHLITKSDENKHYSTCLDSLTAPDEQYQGSTLKLLET